MTQTSPDEFLPPGGGAPTDADAATEGTPADDLSTPEDAVEQPVAASDAPTDFNPASADGATMAGASAEHPVTGTLATTDASQVSPDEQRMYDDFVTRCMLFMNDPRKPIGKTGKPNEEAKSPRDVIIDHLNIAGMKSYDAVGRTAAQICWLIYTNGLRNNVRYPPDVVFHAADEVLWAVYTLGVQAGVIKNPPAPDSKEESELVGRAKFSAAQYFGQNTIDAGLNDQQANREYYMQQMKREADSGQYEQWDPRQQFSPQQLTDFLARASSGKAALAAQTQRAPTSISDFQKAGAPSFVKPGGAGGAGGAGQAAPPAPQEGA